MKVLTDKQRRFLMWVYLYGNANHGHRNVIRDVLAARGYGTYQIMKLRFIRHKHGREYFNTINTNNTIKKEKL